MTPLAPEATARQLTMLAWRRTALHWVVVCVVAARIFSDTLGPVVVVVALVTIALAAWMSIAASREKVPDALRRPVVRLGIVVGGTLALGLASLVWVLAQ